MMSFVMRDGVMGTSQNNSKKKGFYVMPRLTNDEVIRRCKEKHGNKYLYDKVNYVDDKTNILIGCRQHGYFWQNPRNHYKLGCGCPICAGNLKETTESFIVKAQKVHGDFYDYSQVNYVDNRTKVVIICPYHGKFEQTPNKHLSGCDCKKCAVKKRQQTMLKKYGAKHALQSNEIMSRMKSTLLSKYGADNVMQLNYIKHRVDETKIHNGTYGKSLTEDVLYLKLVELFGADCVIRQYKDSRYPFCCDFYVKPLDLFIELNAFWSHGGHWFDSTSVSDLQKLNCWLSKNKAFYKCNARVWSKVDVKKRRTAAQNNLRYVVFWDNALSDFDAWVESGMPVRYDWK